MESEIYNPTITTGAASKIIIEGGRRISGEIKLQGSKNAALPMIVATVINKGITKLNNCPDIGDVDDILQLIETTGCKVKRDGKSSVIIDSTYVTSYEPGKEIAKRTRGSFVLLGALLSRTGRAKVAYPGGCPIGNRPVDIHLKALKSMGMKIISDSDGIIDAVFEKKDGVTIRFPYPSVGATQNCIFAAVLGRGTVTLKNCAREPEVADLCRMLNAMGADITGVGTATLHIKAVEALHDVSWTVMGDRIAAGTYMTAALISNGSVTVRGINPEYIKNETDVLIRTGAAVTMWEDVLNIRRAEQKSPIKPIRRIVTNPYPGFPTDMQSQIMSLLIFADGQSIIKENIFENRFMTVSELIKMGADISVCNKSAKIKGGNKIHGETLSIGDLRGGAALILAALGAEGKSEISGYTHVKRGYENFAGNLKSLGINIIESM